MIRGLEKNNEGEKWTKQETKKSGDAVILENNKTLYTIRIRPITKLVTKF